MAPRLFGMTQDLCATLSLALLSFAYRNENILYIYVPPQAVPFPKLPSLPLHFSRLHLPAAWPPERTSCPCTEHGRGEVPEHCDKRL